jgi:hypothetical protein
MTKKLGTFQFTATGDDLAYLKLPEYPVEVPEGEPIRVARSIDVRDLIPGYVGPDVRLDFTADGTLIAIEVMY